MGVLIENNLADFGIYTPVKSLNDYWNFSNFTET